MCSRCVSSPNTTGRHGPASTGLAGWVAQTQTADFSADAFCSEDWDCSEWAGWWCSTDCKTTAVTPRAYSVCLSCSAAGVLRTTEQVPPTIYCKIHSNITTLFYTWLMLSNLECSFHWTELDCFDVLTVTPCDDGLTSRYLQCKTKSSIINLQMSKWPNSAAA